MAEIMIPLSFVSLFLVLICITQNALLLQI